MSPKCQSAPMASLFISGVQKELQDERRAVKAFVEGDPLLRRYSTAFLFEDLPASDRCALGVFGLAFRGGVVIPQLPTELS